MISEIGDPVSKNRYKPNAITEFFAETTIARATGRGRESSYKALSADDLREPHQYGGAPARPDEILLDN